MLSDVLDPQSNPMLCKENTLYDILIVEDSKFVNDAIKAELEKLGHRCDQAMRLDEALALIAGKKHAFIILDLNLPDACGEELFFAIIRHSEAKIIILTSEQDSEIRATLFKLGVLDYIIKDEKLVKSVQRINMTMQNIRENMDFKILVVDDSSLLRRQVEMILKARSYAILQAKSAKEAIEILGMEAVDMVLLDLELPDMHGSRLLEMIKEDPSHRSTPVLVLSGTNDPELISRVLKGGASDFIQKPFNVEQFVLKVDLWSQLRQQSKGLVQLQRLLQRQVEVLDHDTVVSIVDTRGLFLYASEKFCERFGYSCDTLVSQPFATVCSQQMPEVDFKALCASAEGMMRWQGRMTLKGKGLMECLFDVTINPVLDAGGKLVEYIVFYKAV